MSPPSTSPLPRSGPVTGPRPSGRAPLRLLVAAVVLAAFVGASVVVEAVAAWASPTPRAHLEHAAASGTTLAAGQSLKSGSYHLIMQSDGNLVDYLEEPGGQLYAVWWSGTQGHPGAWTTMQSDGNLVLYAPSGGSVTALWWSGTAGNPGAQLVVHPDGKLAVRSTSGTTLWSTSVGPGSGSLPQPPAGGRIGAGQGLFDGQSIRRRGYALQLLSDGALVITKSGRQRWGTSTAGNSGDFLTMRQDGNLVLYDYRGDPLWASNTEGESGATARLDANGFLVVSLGGRQLWSSEWPASTRYPEGAKGYDISWPQCGSPYPPQSAVGVVGMNDGSAFTTNPCSASEGVWAGAGIDAYMNINSPDYVNSTDDQGPAGSCATGDNRCLAYNFGYNAGVQALSVASGEGLHPAMWWLDVEEVGSCGRFPTEGRAYWSCKKAMNAATIQGALDALHQAGAQAGVYCTNLQWGEITGSYTPSGGTLANWVAGDTASPASSWCTSPRTFGGGQIWLLQLWPPGEWDQDLAC